MKTVEFSSSDQTSFPLSLDQRIHNALAEAHAASAKYGPDAKEAAAAWDIVEELDAEAAHQRAAHSRKTAFSQYCEEFPDAEEARVYDV